MAHRPMCGAMSAGVVSTILSRPVEEEHVLNSLLADIDGREEQVDALAKVSQCDLAS